MKVEKTYGCDDTSLLKDIVILIPAFEPDNHLIELIKELKLNCDYKILIVDDGSGENYTSIFKKCKVLGCIVLKHDKNMGKGCALKTGFAYIKDNTNEKIGVVTADADGQHLVKDILNVSLELSNSDHKIVLGVRKFTGKVPWKSTIGNAFTREIFKLTCGTKVLDTQTGLRGLPIESLPWLLSIEGRHYEYEMNMLLQAKKAGYGFKQVEIDTVYESSNKSSHFRAIKDSISIFIPFLKFCSSGVSAAFVDYFLLFYIQWLTKNLFISVVIARAASSAVNFTVNKFLVFNVKSRDNKNINELISYYLLVCALLFINYFVLSFFSETLHIWLFWSKIITELLLFTISYTFQRLFIFNSKIQA
ncbi:GtrA family protein [Clostridium sp. WILCCON 0269]|uniref:GtrA family protein n=1 Tax=Candidatus Clostridium eludens TaxID=3381663 RepID=A0ABW8SSA0_9CLOT